MFQFKFEKIVKSFSAKQACQLSFKASFCEIHLNRFISLPRKGSFQSRTEVHDQKIISMFINSRFFNRKLCHKI